MKLKEIDLHVTNKCNLSCKICCYSSNELELEEMTTDKIINTIKQASELGCSDLHISGGEPLMRNDLEDICKFALECNQKVRLQTNGLLLTTQRAKCLYDIGVREVMISIDGSRSEIMDSLRGPGSYKAAINGINNAVSSGMDVRINAVVTRKNVNDIVNIAILSNELGATKFSVFYFSPIGRGRKYMDLWLEPEEYLQFWNNIKKDIEINRNEIGDIDLIIEKAYAKWEEVRCISTSGFTGCGGGCKHVTNSRDYLIVRCDGNIYPCILLINETPLGNIKREALHSIWKKSKVWNLLIRPIEKCESCENIDLCNSGCAGYAKILTGQIDNVDPRCKQNYIVPLCPIMKYNYRNSKLGGSSDDVLTHMGSHNN